MTETNPFICYVPRNAKKLVLGSFPCFNGTDYGNFFYSGSGRNFFWPLMAELSGLPADTATQKKRICEAHGIALSDVALKIERRRNNCSDTNLRIIEYNRKGIHQCLSAGVRKVFHTSRFVERHFRRIFPGLQVDAALLLSPSPAANRHIGGLAEYKNALKKAVVKSVYEYRLEQYRELLFGD